MIKFTTVFGEEIRINPEFCSSTRREKAAEIWDQSKSEGYLRFDDVTTLCMSDGQLYRVGTSDFNTHAEAFGAEKFLASEVVASEKEGMTPERWAERAADLLYDDLPGLAGPNYGAARDILEKVFKEALQAEGNG